MAKLHLGAGLGAILVLGACAPVQQLQSVAAAGGALVNSVSAAGEQAPLSAAELRQLQSRDFSATKAAAFASVMTVLLDSGYRVLSADLESGLITAAAATTGRLRLDPGGVARANQTPLASAYVEERGADAVRVRASFTIGRSASGQLATTGERAVLDESIYSAFFEQLRQEITERPGPAAMRPAPGDSSSPPAASDPLPSPTPTADGVEPAPAQESPGDPAGPGDVSPVAAEGGQMKL